MPVIGVDIDGTLAAAGWWSSGEVINKPDPKAVEMVRALWSRGHLLYAWTTRPEYVVKAWLAEHNLSRYFRGINESCLPSESGKASFHYYIGDEAIRWERNVDEILWRINSAAGWDNFKRETNFSDRNLKPYLQGVGRAYVDAFEEHWQQAWKEKGSFAQIAFLTICSHAKPYSKSFIHSTIRKRLHGEELLPKLDYIHISNAGIVPSEVELKYPFCAYDWNGEDANAEVIAYHKATIKRRFSYWFRSHGWAYEHVVVYLRKGGNTYDCINNVITDQGFNVHLIGARNEESDKAPFVLHPDPDDCLTSDRNLDALVAHIKESGLVLPIV